MIRALVLLLLLASSPARACSLALVLALDISSSVNEAEYQIQLGGLARALRAPDIRAAALRAAPLWIAAFEWSGRVQQDEIAPWTRIGSEGDLDALAARIEAHRRTYDVFSTAIGRAVEHGLARFAALPEPCARRVIDVSGDGVNNDDPPARAFHATAAALGVTINGLVIKGAYPDPEAHYRAEVIQGPGAFLMVARNGFEDYPDLIRGKLLREIEPELIMGRLAP